MAGGAGHGGHGPSRSGCRDGVNSGVAIALGSAAIPAWADSSVAAEDEKGHENGDQGGGKGGLRLRSGHRPRRWNSCQRPKPRQDQSVSHRPWRDRGDPERPARLSARGSAGKDSLYVGRALRDVHRGPSVVRHRARGLCRLSRAACDPDRPDHDHQPDRGGFRRIPAAQDHGRGDGRGGHGTVRHSDRANGRPDSAGPGTGRSSLQSGRPLPGRSRSGTATSGTTPHPQR